jgi:hypothetical protein
LMARKPTKINWGWTDDGKGGYRHVRISKISGLEIPKPPPPVRERVAGQFDTRAEEAHKETFVPSLANPPIPKDCIL